MAENTSEFGKGRGGGGGEASELHCDSAVENIACCFHYCTLELHMQEKGGMSKHHNQLRVFANLK